MTTFTDTALAESLRDYGVAAIFGHADQGDADQLHAFRLPGGAVIPWRRPGTEGREAHLAAALCRVVAEGAQRVHAVETDATRTDSWKSEQRQRISAEVRDRFERARAEADAAVAAFEAADAAEAVPAPLAAGDVAAALVDHEIRAWLRERSQDELIALAKELDRPERARVVEAILRSPVPWPPLLTQVARDAWLSRKAAADPQAARQRRDAAERVAWLRDLAEQLASLVAPPIVPAVRRAA